MRKLIAIALVMAALMAFAAGSAFAEHGSGVGGIGTGSVRTMEHGSGIGGVGVQ